MGMRIKKLYGLLLNQISHYMGMEFCKTIDGYIRFHKKVNLKNPTRLSDKICWLSIHGDLDMMSRCSDKWAVRDYIREKNLERILVPVYGNVIRSVEELDWSQFPEQFVLKGTHGCKMNIICENREDINYRLCEKLVEDWLNTTYGVYSMEPHYKKIIPGIYCESLLGKPSELKDYKYFCYNGRPEWILVCGNREIKSNGESHLSMYAFDTNWMPMHVIRGWKHHNEGDEVIQKPKKLKEMLEIACILSADFDFVRVDLYEVNEKIYFGELTFTPASGIMAAYDQDFLLEEGKKLRITCE